MADLQEPGKEAGTRRHSYLEMEHIEELATNVSVEVPSKKTTRSEAKWSSIIPSFRRSNSIEGGESQGENGKKFGFLFRRRSHGESRGVRKYYERLKKDEKVLKEAEELITDNEEEENANEAKPDKYHTALDSVIQTTKRVEDEEHKDTGQKKSIKNFLQISVGAAARITLSANLLLFFFKLAASIQSGSLSVISSLVDSALDLFSGFTIGLASYLMHHYNQYQYPIGRNRLEPVAIIITAAVMGTAALQIVTTAITDIASGSLESHINGFSGSIIAFTIILKGILFLICFRVDSPSVKALATDHRNDFASNIATLIFGLLGTYVWKYFDPIGALLLALYIIINWVLVGREQMVNLVGYRANRRFTSKIIYIALQHDKEILKVDTVRAYTFGVRYLVELHVALKPDMALEKAHDIGESLQLKLESLKEVERAFVHLDFETKHAPSSEHILSGPDD